MLKNLFNEFPVHSKQDWEEQIAKDLKVRAKEDVIETSEDGLRIQPDYADRPTSIAQSFRKKNQWYISSEIGADRTNQDVLNALGGGCNSLLVHTTQNSNLEHLFANVMLDIIDCTIIHHGTSTVDIERELDQYLEACYDKTVNTRVICDPFEEGPGLTVIPKNIFINAAHYRNAGSTASEEISIALAHLTEVLTHTPDYIHIQLGIGLDYFGELAKFRAFRLLVQQVITEFNWTGEIRVSAIPSTYYLSTKEVNNNLLRLSTMAMSAVLGGCDQLVPVSHDLTDDQSSERTARNIQHIMTEEVHLSKISDPASGAFFIETLTAELSQLAWRKFQKIELDGGFLSFLESGKLQEQLEKSNGKRVKQFRTLDKTMLGVNKHVMKESGAASFEGLSWNGIKSRNLSEEIGKGELNET